MSRKSIANKKLNESVSRRTIINTCRKKSLDEDSALYNDYLLSVYYVAMTEKKFKEIKRNINEEFQISFKEECKLRATQRELSNRIFRISHKVKAIKIMDAELDQKFSVEGELKEFLEDLKGLTENLEKTLNQLKMKNVRSLSSSDRGALVKEIETAVSLLSDPVENLEEYALQYSGLIEKLQCLNSDLNPRKERCESLIKAINELGIKKSADVIIETSRVCL